MDSKNTCKLDTINKNYSQEICSQRTCSQETGSIAGTPGTPGPVTGVSGTPGPVTDVPGAPGSCRTDQKPNTMTRDPLTRFLVMIKDKLTFNGDKHDNTKCCETLETDNTMHCIVIQSNDSMPRQHNNNPGTPNPKSKGFGLALSQESEIEGTVGYRNASPGTESTVQPIVISDEIEPVFIELNETDDKYIEQQLDQILKDLVAIKNISRDMAMILDVQSTQLSAIESNVENTHHTIHAADLEIKKAIQYKNNAQHHMIGMTTGAITGSFFGPVGAIIGAGIGLSSSTLYNLIK
jgi:hypothetical protein